MFRCPARAACLPDRAGVQIVCSREADLALALQDWHGLMQEMGWGPQVLTQRLQPAGRHVLWARLSDEARAAWTPDHDTLGLAQRLPPGPVPHQNPLLGLQREALAALLAAPLPMAFASVAALRSHLRVRAHICAAARRTALAFKTEAAERPQAFWHYDDEHGFLLQHGANLIDALRAATEPEVTGRLYDFSCYRASEYVILLGLAQELQAHHPALYAQLQVRSEHDAIRSGLFHEVFLVEYGSMEAPLPARYYVPGDRLWFRNPDERSSDITGYEGSWVIYMGGGLFSNFWKREQPFTLEDKCLEIFHWRDGAVQTPDGSLEMDETRVEAEVARTRADPQACASVLARMMRMRDPKGVYAEGGCIDTTREFPRGAWPDDCELTLPPWS